jgi:hypothetical protein
MRFPMMLKGSVAAKRSQPFRHIASAPRDGTLIEVRHGPDQGIVLAPWAGQNQAFVRDDDPLRRTLNRVSLWRPAKPRGQGASDSGRSGAADRMADPASPGTAADRGRGGGVSSDNSTIGDRETQEEEPTRAREGNCDAAKEDQRLVSLEGSRTSDRNFYPQYRRTSLWTIRWGEFESAVLCGKI